MAGCSIFAVILYYYGYDKSAIQSPLLLPVEHPYDYMRFILLYLGSPLGWGGLRASAQWVLPLAILLYLPMLLYGFAHHRLVLLRPTWQSLVPFFGYGSWCVIQQYLTQSYFHNRLMLVIRNRHVRAALIGIMFSAAHIPNLILMIATLVAGIVFAEVFSRYRNIWPLALAQAVGGLLLAAVAPDALIHHLRVGPGYFFYGIR